MCVARVLLRLLLTLTRTPLPPQLTNSWPVLGDSTLWAGFVPSSVFEIRLANPTLTLSLTLTQTPLPQLTAKSQLMGWRLDVAPCGLVMCACRTHAAVVCVWCWILKWWVSTANRSALVVPALQTGSRVLPVQDIASSVHTCV